MLARAKLTSSLKSLKDPEAIERGSVKTKTEIFIENANEATLCPAVLIFSQQFACAKNSVIREHDPYLLGKRAPNYRRFYHGRHGADYKRATFSPGQ